MRNKYNILVWFSNKNDEYYKSVFDKIDVVAPTKQRKDWTKTFSHIIGRLELNDGYSDVYEFDDTIVRRDFLTNSGKVNIDKLKEYFKNDPSYSNANIKSVELSSHVVF